MSDPTTQPAPGTAAPPASSPPSDTSPPVASRPEWLPEAHWDTTANAIKPDFGKHYGEVAAFHKTETDRKAALAALKPEDLKLELPADFKTPDGVKVKVDEKDPRVPLARQVAKDLGLDQAGFSKLLALDAQIMLAAQQAETARVAEENKKLGANAEVRKTAVGNWIRGLGEKGDLSADEIKALATYATDAAAISALEKLMTKANGSVPGVQPAVPATPQPKSIAERMYPHLPSGLPPASARSA